MTTPEPPSEAEFTVESLPHELLHAIVTMNPETRRSARRVSRTLLAASQRCHQPIRLDELRAYLNQLPQQFAYFETWEKFNQVFDRETYECDEISFHVYSYLDVVRGEMVSPDIGPTYSRSLIVLVFGGGSEQLDESTGLEVKDDWIAGVNPVISLQSVITYWLTDQETIDTYRFDLLTQWRILITRLGCLGSPSSDYVSGVRDYAREFLHRQLNDTSATIRHHVDDLIDSYNPIEKLRPLVSCSIGKLISTLMPSS
jgi:hypothetical protein